MVSPTKPGPIGTPGYSSVPNPEGSPTVDQFQSPDPNRSSAAYNDLSGNNLPESSLLSPEAAETSMLRPDSGIYPAASIMSRDSSLPGTPQPDNRSSWGSAAALNVGADGRPKTTRGQSALHHSTVGEERASSDDGEGHIAPGAAAAGAGAAGAGAGAAAMNEKSPRWAEGANGQGKSRKKLWIILGAIVLLLAAGLAVGLGVGLTRGDRATRDATESSGAGADGNNSNNPTGTSGGSASASGTSSSAPTPSATSGSRGSTVLLEDGTEMTYDNPYGGTWVFDPSNPLNNDAQANSWTPPLSQNWTWGVDKIYGVNVGGWLDTEPFIVPGLYEVYAEGAAGTAVDEYTLIQNMGDNATAAMTEHYETFITERDFVEMVSAGINWVRLPIGHWAIQTSPEEPYLDRVSWTYVLRAIKWARKYGLRINFDLHTLPGSQNGWNHSGRIGPINWLSGAMGLANAQRSLEIIRTITQFIVQPEYAPVIPMWGFVNEPNANLVGQNAVGSFYYEVYRMVRGITGVGEGNGPMLSMHDGFVGIQAWYDFMTGADRMALDQHPYMCFGDQNMGPIAEVARTPCTAWAAGTNETSRRFGANSAGEWSAAVNDCGQWLNRVGAGARYENAFPGYNGPNGGPGACDYWNDHRLWDDETKSELLNVVTRSMDALQNYFFWTWKIGNSTGSIPEPNPMWHYRLGLREGWVPQDPRSAIGACAAMGVTGEEFSGTYPSAWMTGGAGADEIPASVSNAYPWPPASFTNVAAGQMTLLPQYTTTGTPVTMPAETFTSPGSSETINVGDGWANAQDDTRSAFVPISGCSYPPEYSAQDVQPTAGACGAGLTQPAKRAPAAKRTPAPAPRPRY